MIRLYRRLNVLNIRINVFTILEYHIFTILVETLYPKIENSTWCVEIRNIRKMKRITQEELARNTGISQSRISHIESGRVDPKLTEVIGMAAALKMDMGMYPSAAVPFVEETLMEWKRCDDPEDQELTIPELILGDRAHA